MTKDLSLLGLAFSIGLAVTGCSGADVAPIAPGSTPPAGTAAAAADFGSSDPFVGVWVEPSAGGGAYSFTLHANGHMARGIPDGSGPIESPCAESDLPAAARGVESDGNATKCGAWKRDGDAVTIHWPGLPKSPYRCAIAGEMLRCDDDSSYAKGVSAEGAALAGTFALESSGRSPTAPTEEITNTNIVRKMTFRGDRFEASKWLGMTTSYDPTMTNKQGTTGVATDGAVSGSYRIKGFTIETTLDDGTTDKGRAYVVLEKGAIALLYVQGYGHMVRAD